MSLIGGATHVPAIVSPRSTLITANCLVCCGFRGNLKGPDAQTKNQPEKSEQLEFESKDYRMIEVWRFFVDSG